MSVWVILLLAFGVGLTLSAVRVLREDDGPFWATILLIMAGGAFLWAYHEADPATEAARQAERKAAQEQEQQDMQPRVVREVDGCKVYAFKSMDRWHYFTKCPDASTTTDTAYEECTGSGKTRRCYEKHDTIETR